MPPKKTESGNQRLLNLYFTHSKPNFYTRLPLLKATRALSESLFLIWTYRCDPTTPRPNVSYSWWRGLPVYVTPLFGRQKPKLNQT